MKELHLHSASPRQLDSIINQNQIIQLPVRLPACPSVRPPVRLSACPFICLPVWLLGKEKNSSAFSFSSKIKHFPPAAWSHSTTVSISFSCSVSLPFSHSRSCSFFISYTCCPFGPVAPSNGTVWGADGQPHQIYIRTINFNFWSTSNSVWQSGFWVRHRDVSIQLSLDYPPPSPLRRKQPNHIRRTSSCNL